MVSAQRIQDYPLTFWEELFQETDGKENTYIEFLLEVGWWYLFDYEAAISQCKTDYTVDPLTQAKDLTSGRAKAKRALSELQAKIRVKSSSETMLVQHGTVPVTDADLCTDPMCSCETQLRVVVDWGELTVERVGQCNQDSGTGSCQTGKGAILGNNHAVVSYPDGTSAFLVVDPSSAASGGAGSSMVYMWRGSAAAVSDSGDKGSTGIGCAFAYEVASGMLMGATPNGQYQATPGAKEGKLCTTAVDCAADGINQGELACMDDRDRHCLTGFNEGCAANGRCRCTPLDKCEGVSWDANRDATNFALVGTSPLQFIDTQCGGDDTSERMCGYGCPFDDHEFCTAHSYCRLSLGSIPCRIAFEDYCKRSPEDLAAAVPLKRGCCDEAQGEVRCDDPSKTSYGQCAPDAAACAAMRNCVTLPTASASSEAESAGKTSGVCPMHSACPGGYLCVSDFSCR
jgi:hypothetical protein